MSSVLKKKEVSMKGFELVAFAGEARSLLLEALEIAKNGDPDLAKEKVQEAEELINKAHIAQMDLIVEEARENYSDVTITMVHGQDHLMTTILLKELSYYLIDLLSKK